MGITVEEKELETARHAGAKRLISRRGIAMSRHGIAVSCLDTMVSGSVAFAGAGCEDS